jgi:hypothetical protein
LFGPLNYSPLCEKAKTDKDEVLLNAYKKEKADFRGIKPAFSKEKGDKSCFSIYSYCNRRANLTKN